jgi:hypothetical protein
VTPPLTLARVRELVALHDDGLFTEDEVVGRIAREAVLPALVALEQQPETGWHASVNRPPSDAEPRQAVVIYDEESLVFRRAP